MLPSDITMVESAILNVEFNQTMLTPGEGTIKVTYGALDFEVGGGVLTENPSMQSIKVSASPIAQGFRKDVEKPDFSLKIDIRMIFSYPKDEIVDEDFLKDHTWYFSSLMRVYFKFYAEDILKNTTLDGIKFACN
ncbi:hypothetical protein BWD41_05360 [Citrobacter braakii]|uniref:Uncharacterized protein n=1 Tax=Citrobacter braakii TaxID=57706 RepID=A0AA44RJ99_CITBR|nr:hypothetical protein [Citrobacter braakii]EJG2186764.1 hypothetical protein [Citrobacter freundii]OLY71078.1 hypothetical protein BWD41_05360 [Citrobacter braakii]